MQNSNGETALHRAAFQSNLHLLFPLDKHKNIISKLIVLTDNVKIAELLIKNCAALNVRNNDKRAPLHLAVLTGDLQIENIKNYS